MKSISRRLLALLLGGLLVVGLAAGIATYLKAREELDELFDDQLTQMAYAFSRQESIAQLPSPGIRYEEEDDFAIQVWKNGSLVFANFPTRTLPIQSEGISTAYSEGKFWRFFVLRTGSRVIQVSQPIEARREISLDFTLRTIAPLLLAFPAFGLIIWLAVRSGLRPLSRLAGDISRRSPAALGPVPRNGLPVEVVPLADHLNLLLEKLAHSIETQKRFVADAAHELRTPLAAVRLQARVLEKSASEAERAEALDRLKEGVGRAARMVGQLLALARLEPEAPRLLSRVMLTGLAREMVGERARIALKRGVDLGMADSETIVVTGEEEALRAIIANLIDNAIRHAPWGGAVDVTVRSDAHGVIIGVVDTGPGIPPEDRDRVFDRFFRKGTSSGSGLGLAIVKSAVERHGGTISLSEGRDGKGLKVTVFLPLVPFKEDT